MTKQESKGMTEESPQEETAGQADSGGRVLFPRDSLKEALKVPMAIERDNAGQPYDPILMATQSLGTTHRSSGFEIILASSLRYGLTLGNSRAKTITLTPLGSAIAAPTDESQTGTNLRRALLMPELFSKFYQMFDRKNLPRDDILKNVLEKKLGVPRKDVGAALTVLNQNIVDYNLIVTSGENRVLYLDKLAKATTTLAPPLMPSSGAQEDTQQMLNLPPEEKPAPPPVIEPLKPKLIFVAHGKNKKPLEQAVKILEDYGIKHVVAIEEANRARPISTKVADEMNKCTAGIFIFTADEKTTDADGNEVWRPSDNLVYELGAGSVLYGNKIVIFREEGVDFASDFKEIGNISFEKNKLDAKGLDLIKELRSLGIIKFEVA